MYIDINKPPPPLPVASPTQVRPFVTLLPPLSRQGIGPGLIILTPTSPDNLAIKNGVPSPLRKWAEEGFAVVEIQEPALSTPNILMAAITALKSCEKCNQRGTFGLVAYGSHLWHAVAPEGYSLHQVTSEATPRIMEVVVYADASEQPTLVPENIRGTDLVPLTCHFAGKLSSPAVRLPQHTEYEYPSMQSQFFAVSSHPDFNYPSEAVSHTRSLTALKKRLQGPYFDLEAIWDEHTYFEFENRSVEHTMATMVDEPYVNHIPTITGGIGRESLTKFYTENFIFKNPKDTELELISRTTGIDRVVDEFIFKFTHDSDVDWLIPGIPPTGKYLQIPMIAIVNFRGDRLYHEHISWDQGTVLAQLGLLPEYLPYRYPLPSGKQIDIGKRLEYKLPIAGVEAAEKMRDKNSVASNEMLAFGVQEVDKR